MSLRGRGSRTPKAATERLVQYFVDRHLRPEAPAAFAVPDGFPPHMMIYDRWLDRGMHPRDVDRLTRDELFWLPVIADAKAEAGRQVAAIEDK